MLQNTYPWKRLWQRQQPIPTPSSSATPLQPPSDEGDPLASGQKTLEALHQEPCLVLLGASGMGKTQELNRVFGASAAPGIVRIKKDFLASTNAADLKADLFHDVAFQEWKTGSGILELWIDALDEGLLTDIKGLNGLTNALGGAAQGRLRLRLLCRPGVWPQWLEQKLLQFWPTLSRWELQGLTREDVWAAATSERLEPTKFWREVVATQSQALAYHPLSLSLLITLYRREQTLPSSRAQLYEEGLKGYYQDQEPRAQAGTCDARGVLLLDLDQRLALAGRIAALSLLCHRPLLWRGEVRHAQPGGSLSLEALVGTGPGRSEDLKAQNIVPFDATLARVKELFPGGPFSSLGDNCVGWLHRSFAEFLAARYLARLPHPVGILIDWLTVPDGPERRIVPHLEGLAAWLASFSPDLFDWIVETQPTLMVEGDLVSLTDDQRATLIDKLLNRYAKPDGTTQHRRIFFRREELAHPRMAEQLRPWIEDSSLAPLSRLTAIRFAQEAELKDVRASLLNVALSPDERRHFRTAAVKALKSCAGADEFLALHPLMHLPTDEDPDDELLGATLTTLWPDHMTVEELFAALRPAHAPDRFATYSYFVYSVWTLFPNGDALQRALPTALQWATQRTTTVKKPRISDPLQSMLHTITDLAWQHMDNADVFPPYIDFLHAALEKNWGKLPGKQFCQELVANQPDITSRRHRLIRALLPLGEVSHTRPPRLSRTEPAIIHEGDLPWLLEQARLEIAADLQARWARLIQGLLNSVDLAHLELVTSAIELSPALEAHLGHYIKVELNGEKAQQLRTEWEERKHHNDWWRIQVEAEAEARNHSLTVRDRALEAALHPEYDLSRFPDLVRALAKDEDGIVELGLIYEDSLLCRPAWQSASEELRSRILHLAEQFLVQNRHHTGLGTDDRWSVELYGLHAFVLLNTATPDRLAQLPDEVWNDWIPTLVTERHFLGALGTESTRSPAIKSPITHLLPLAYARAPHAVVASALKHLCAPALESAHADVSGKLLHVWDEMVATTLLKAVQDDQLQPVTLGRVFGDLLMHNTQGALEWAMVRLQDCPDTGPTEVQQAIIGSLLVHKLLDSWPTVWPILEAYPVMAKVLLLRYLWPFTGQAFPGPIQTLPLEALETLIGWLHRHFATARDSDDRHGDEWHLYKLKYNLLQAINIRTRQQELEALTVLECLERMKQGHPDLLAIHSHMEEIRRFHHSQTWSPHVPSTLLPDLTTGVWDRLHRQLLNELRKLDGNRVFVSYARESLRVVQPLCNRLRDATVKTFVDCLDLRGGEDWKARIRAELEIADAILLFWNKNANDSPNVREEWEYALELHTQRRITRPALIPILLDKHRPDAPHPLAKYDWIFLNDTTECRE